MESSLKPYEGLEPYVFVSYSHKDSEKVFAILKRLQTQGLRIWYDKGIEWGSEWPDDIAEHISNCQCFMAFHSKNSKNSRNCRQEIYFAIRNEKDILSVYLEEVKLNAGIEMQLAPFQATYFYQYAEEQIEEFYSILSQSKFLVTCYQKLEQKNIELSINKRLIPEEIVLPIVFILDTSGSMYDKLEVLNKSIREMIKNLSIYSNNTKWESTIGSSTTYVKSYEIAIITFGSEVKILMNYTDVEKINSLPEIEANGMTAFGEALKVAKNMIDDPTVTLESWQNPVVILVTDGYPSDDYLETLFEFATDGNSAYSKRYAIGIGENVDKKVLRQFAVNPILTKTELELEQSFQIITNYIMNIFYL